MHPSLCGLTMREETGTSLTELLVFSLQICSHPTQGAMQLVDQTKSANRSLHHQDSSC